MTHTSEELPEGPLQDVALGMAITADVTRSDLVLVRPVNENEVRVIAQARPHSISPLHTEDLVDRTWTARDAAVVLDAWQWRRAVREQVDLPSGAAVRQEILPVCGPDRRIIGLLSVETSLLQLERHSHRHVSFRRAMMWLKAMCARGELAAAAGLSPFGEMDGVLLADTQRRITYLSGIAGNLYRRLEYKEDLRGRRLSYLETGEDEMAAAALQSRRPLELESTHGAYICQRKVLPVWAPPDGPGWLGRITRLPHRWRDAGGVLILLHDATEERRKGEELQVKNTMIQEVHHRVKNNLQTIAAVMRLQARRTPEVGAQQSLSEAIARILSVAVIHEFLSLNENQTINIRDVCQRIVAQTRQVMEPSAQIDLSVEGPAIHLPSQQATACALVINELIQNALKHGYEAAGRGRIQVALTDGGDTVHLEVYDDGAPLPDDFSLDDASSLGLQIVTRLVQSDLHGEVRLENRTQGVAATVTFPKAWLGQGALN